MRRLIWRGLLVCGAVLAIGTGLWWAGPSWLAPTEDFAQGPGGAAAYISLSQQLRDQWTAVSRGGEIRLVMTEEEFSGMLASVLLSGRGEDRAVRKVRGRLAGEQIRVDAVLHSRDPRLPARYQRPVGLTLYLNPEVAGDGAVRFLIRQARAGRIPLPLPLLRWTGRWFQVPGFDAQRLALTLPLVDLVQGQLGRKVDVTEFAARGGKLYLAGDIARPGVK